MADMMTNILKPKRGKATTLKVINPVLERGEIIFELPDDGTTSGGLIKMGDGSTPYNDLGNFIAFESDNYVKVTDLGESAVPLNSLKQIDPKYIPDYFNNVQQYPDPNYFPLNGEEGIIYIDSSASENNLYRWDKNEKKYVTVAKSTTYKIEKDGSSVVLKGSDGSTSSITNVGGVEIRDDDPKIEELYPGKMWIKLSK